MPNRKSKRWVRSTNPTTGRPLRRFRAATKTDVGKAVEKAKKAFEKWRQLPPSKRAVYLERTARPFEPGRKSLAGS